MADDANRARLSKGTASLKARIELLERELGAFVELSVEKRVILRLMPVLNQALTRYIDDKIERAVRKDRILQVFVPYLDQLGQDSRSGRDTHRVLTRLRDEFVTAAERGKTEDLLDRLELAQLRACEDQNLAQCLGAILSHHVIAGLCQELSIRHAIAADLLAPE